MHYLHGAGFALFEANCHIFLHDSYIIFDNVFGKQCLNDVIFIIISMLSLGYEASDRTFWTILVVVKQRFSQPEAIFGFSQFVSFNIINSEPNIYYIYIKAECPRKQTYCVSCF